MLATPATLLLAVVSPVAGSWGDQTSYYQMCVQHCSRHTCGDPAQLATWARTQPLQDAWAGVTCAEDCRYTCMWDTVREMEERHGMATGVPQFHGKWPFVRVWGMTEPASVLFSLLNLATNIWMLVWFRRTVPAEAPMFSVWTFYSLTAINAWVCSSIFHTRDTAATEMMDYFSAFLTVLASLLVCVLRILGPGDARAGVVVAGFAAFYSHHVYSMAAVSFDYGYNMKVNVAVGVLNGLLWLGWAWRHAADGPHVRRGCVAILALSLGVLLELLDFPPWAWLVDSHALWHLVTVPVPLLWMDFAAGDCLRLARDLGTQKSKKLS